MCSLLRPPPAPAPAPPPLSPIANPPPYELSLHVIVIVSLCSMFSGAQCWLFVSFHVVVPSFTLILLLIPFGPRTTALCCTLQMMNKELLELLEGLRQAETVSGHSSF